MAIEFQILTHEEAERNDLLHAIRLSPEDRFRRGIALYERTRLLTNQSMRLVEDFHLNLIRLFKEVNLDYLIVGGHAVNVHGYLRGSDDFDVWLNNSTANLSMFRRVLLQLGIEREDVHQLVQSIAKPGDRAVFRFRINDYSIDFLLHLHGAADYIITKERCFRVTVGDTEIPFVSLENLIASKLAAGRPKDLLDVEILRRIEDEKEQDRS